MPWFFCKLTPRTAGRCSFQFLPGASPVPAGAWEEQEISCEPGAGKLSRGSLSMGSWNNLASKRETQKPSLGVGTWFLLVFNKVFERKEKLRWGCSLVETGVDLSDQELVSLSLGCLPLQTR